MMPAPGDEREVHMAARIEGQATFTIVDRMHPGLVGPAETGQLALSRTAMPDQGSMAGMVRSELVHVLAAGTTPKPEEERR